LLAPSPSSNQQSLSHPTTSLLPIFYCIILPCRSGLTFSQNNMSSIKSVFAIGLLATADIVAGHAAIIAATGDAGGQGMALGIDSSTPRDGTRRNPFQADSTRFKGDAADTFGETVGAGTNDLETGTKAMMAETGTMLPQVSPGGSVDMTLHQVNGDGGGPYDCMINADGTGAAWTNINVVTTPPGQNSRNRDGAMTDFPLKAAIPADQTCTGTVAGQSNVCLVRCQNAARAGPFGGVVPVQMAGTTTPAAARRNLMLAVKRSDDLLKKMIKRAQTPSAAPEDDPAYLAELRADGEEI
ncbi:MAS3 protein, partial [Colletotrichum tofieldiae]